MYRKNVGACVSMVKSPHIPPHCAIQLIHIALEVKMSFQGILLTDLLFKSREVPFADKMYCSSRSVIRGCNLGESKTKKCQHINHMIPIVQQK
jgi:hypothetical protein